MPLESRTVEAQRALAEVCRSGVAVSIPGARPERVMVYRDLVRNGVEDTLRRAYPILHADLTADPGDLWRTLVDEFLARGSLPSPELWKMPRELLSFLDQGGYCARFNRPYLDDLARFEWAEIEVHLMPDDRPAGVRFAPHLTRAAELTLNRESLIEAYQYPVFRSPPKELASLAGSYFLLIFRHPAALDVRFVELAPLTALALGELRGSPRTFEALTTALEVQLQSAAVTIPAVDTTQLWDTIGVLAELGAIGIPTGDALC